MSMFSSIAIESEMKAILSIIRRARKKGLSSSKILALVETYVKETLISAEAGYE